MEPLVELVVGLAHRLSFLCRLRCLFALSPPPGQGRGGQLEMDRLAGLGTTQAMGQRHQQAVQQRMLVGQQASCTPDFGAMSTLGLLWMRRVFPAFSKVRR
jgi:hypothetical protein